MSLARSKFVILGLSLSSSWGNGHATTYRALLRGLAARGHEILFLERDVPWYAAHRDLVSPDFCEIGFYASLDELHRRYGAAIASADHVILGSYVPDGIDALDFILNRAQGTRCFYDIDTPVTAAALARGTCAYLSPRQIPKLDLYLSFSSGPILANLARQFGARRPRPLYCSVDETRYRPQPLEFSWDLAYVGTYSSDRQPMLERLLLEPARRLPDCRFVVAGPQYPAEMRWPANVTRIEHLAAEDHATFYSRQRFTLNITRADMAAAGWSPSVRLFEAAACGTPIISDDWPGLTELFPAPEAIRIAETADDVITALTRSSEPVRRKMAATARGIVVAAHTGKARARELEHYLAEASSSFLVKRSNAGCAAPSRRHAYDCN